jgi:hypothetical protein
MFVMPWGTMRPLRVLARKARNGTPPAAGSDQRNGRVVSDWLARAAPPVVLVHDPQGRLDPSAYFSTRTHDQPRTIVHQCIKRWSLETSFEESRAHLSLDTQRQWSVRAIARTTPCLVGLSSVVALLDHVLHPDEKIPRQRTAWYDKPQATFADVLAAVHRHLWGELSYSTSVHTPDLLGIPRLELLRLVQAVWYAN